MLHGPSMLSPADVVCNECVAELWASEESEEAMTTHCAGTVRDDLGVAPGVIAEGIVMRITKLRKIARSKAELEQMLSDR